MQSAYIHLLGWTISLASLSAEIRVNEIMASNTRAWPEITDFEDYPDWIELHNTGSSEASLAGYFLSDDADDPLLWRFANDATIPAGGYLVISADGHDAPIGKRFSRDYWPFRAFTTEKHHTNFSLSAAGEQVLLSKVEIQHDTAIFFNSQWRYLDDGSDQGSLWKEPAFDDSGWPAGFASFGYNDPISTIISFGPDPTDPQITSYFRKSFQIEDLASLGGAQLNFVVDDGCVIYLNGQEVTRHNMGNGPINFDTTAESAVTFDVEETIHSFPLSSSAFQAGENIIAVEVHQASDPLADMRFNLELILSNLGDSTLIDSVTYPQQVTDVSYGRSPTNPDLWVQFAESTPGATNDGPLVTDLRTEGESVTISPKGGLLPGATMVTLTGTQDPIHYTLNGSEPTTSSLLYTAPFTINSRTVVRARSFPAGKVPGPISTRTYFIGENFSGLPYLSMVAEHETLFGDRIGIDTNTHEPRAGRWPAVYKGKDAPGHLEFFPTDGSEGFAVNGGFRIGGENNWASHRQRAFNFALRGRYGDSSIDYDLFPGSRITNFTALTIREGGDDWGKAHLTDAIFDTIVRNRMEVETNKYRPSLLFINGEYWGLYNIRDRWDDHWFFQHYGTNDGEYDRLSYSRSAPSPVTVEHGSSEEWDELLSYLDRNDVSDPNVWSEIEDRIEVDSFIDYIVCEVYGRNSSWAGNREHWKDGRPGSKWRWFIPDMDRTFGNSGNSRILGAMLRGDHLLLRVRRNPTFVARLAQRFAAHRASSLRANRIIDIINQFSSVIEPHIQRQYDRWSAPSQPDFQLALSTMRDTAQNNSDLLLAEVQENFALEAPVNLTLAVNMGSAQFRLAGVTLDTDTLQIFPSLLTELEIIPAPGFRFVRWNGADGDSRTSFNLFEDTTITALLEPDSSTELSGTLNANRTLSVAESPYIITEDLIIPNGLTLTINPGVILEFERDINLRVLGTINALGTMEDPIQFLGRRDTDWGGISFENTETLSRLNHIKVRHATRGVNPLIYPAAIAGLNAEVEMDFIDIADSRAPLFFRGGRTILRDSIIHIPITGDGINIKNGEAQTIRCTFLGNNAPDTDAIDYDGVVNGLIQDCRIYRFFGFNSDGIDTGEQCVDILVEGNKIFFNSDKGISVGQGSSVIARNNLIVGCQQGIGVKDTGSVITLDQNTFVDCPEGVAIFEKNFGAGGGSATIENTIFSGSQIPVSADNLSSVDIRYSLSDTLLLQGNNNLRNEAGFTAPDRLDYSLRLDSIARNSGEPAHANDPDGTRADRGALYTFDPEDYPFLIDNTIVVNEILANSGDEPDWIELHNRSDEAVDIGGWLLSDDGSDLAKYRIADGTILPARGYLTFFEDMHFGATSGAPGKITGFGLSRTGETVHLSSATNDVITDYRFKEQFGAAQLGFTQGFYYKPSSDSFNFVTLDRATLNQPNAPPKNGPIIISEIHFDPQDPADAEYLELVNISETPINLSGWKITEGLTFTFPEGSTIQPNERIILAGQGNIVTPGQIFRWTAGKLNNGGERIELGQPGEDPGIFIRIDRVNYDVEAPWRIESGKSLSKIVENRYGNDAYNWQPSPPSPGRFNSPSRYQDWADLAGVSAPAEDPDQDGISNLVEYALGSNPRAHNGSTPIALTPTRPEMAISYLQDPTKADVHLELQGSDDLITWERVTTTPGLPAENSLQEWRSNDSLRLRRFYRLWAIEK